MNHRIAYKSLVALAVVVCTVAAFVAGQAAYKAVQKGERSRSLLMYGSVLRLAGRTPLAGSANTLAKQIDLRPYELFSKVEHQLYAYYVEKIHDSTPLAQGTADWMIDSLGDPYSRFLDPLQYEAYLARLKGDYAGIGALLACRRVPAGSGEEDLLRELIRQEPPPDRMPDLLFEPEDINTVQRDANGEVRYRFPVVVLAPVRGGPAEAAGLRPGDVVRKVNGKFTFRRNLDSLDEMLLVPRTGRVKLTVTRSGSPKPVDLEVPLALTHVPPVAARYHERVGIIAVRTMGPGVADEVRAKVREQTARGVSGIILDLRCNAEGEEAEVCRLASMFVPDGVLLRVKERGGQWRDVRADASRGVGKVNKLAVLVDETTAGPAEALAAVLKARGAGRLFGATTFGLGIRQTLFELPGKSAILLTTGLVTVPLPDGSLMELEGKGVSPDVEVAAPEGGRDAVLDRAIEWLESKGA